MSPHFQLGAGVRPPPARPSQASDANTPTSQSVGEDAVGPPVVLPVTELPVLPVVTGPARRSDFSSDVEKPRRPADVLPSRVAETMLAVYRAKYGIDAGTIVFIDHKAKAAEVRAWCDSLAPGTCAWALGSSGSGIHKFALAVGRSADGVPRCLLVDSSGLCMHRVVAELDAAFDGKLYLTPRIQRRHELGCIVFAMRFLLLTRVPEFAGNVLLSLEDFDRQYQEAMPAIRQLGLDDCWRMAGWLAGTQLRNEIQKPDFLLSRPLNNGGRHADWTMQRFFDERPYNLTQEVRNMYVEVDLLRHEPARSLVSPERKAYLHKRFLQYLPSGPLA